MKKTFTINISGIVFHIDDDAYDRLNNYIYRINKHFGDTPEGKEIEEDIESRVSELFQERIKNRNEAISLSQVDEIIKIMGMPESFGEQATEKESSNRVTTPHHRKLYRDPDDRVLGGVSSGLGAYFNLDPIIIRLIFILLFFAGGSSILIYLVLWIIVPKASNTTQRLEMKGEEVNISNISKSIKEEIQEVKENYQNFKTNKTGADTRARFDQVGELAGATIRALLKVVAVALGIALLVASILTIISFVTSLLFTHEILGFSLFHNGMPGIFHLFVSPTTLNWFWIGLALTIGIPLIMIAYLGLKLIFRFKSNNHAVGLTTLGLWIIGLFLILYSTIKGVSDFKNSATYKTEHSIETKSDTLYLSMGDDKFSDSLLSGIKINGVGVVTINDDHILLSKPKLKIEKSESNDFSLTVKIKARGKDIATAQDNARVIEYQYTLKDSSLTFQPWAEFPKKSIWRNQEVFLSLKVPVNKTIYLTDGMEKILSEVKNTSDMWDEDMPGKYWTMKPEGLELVQRKRVLEETKK